MDFLKLEDNGSNLAEKIIHQLRLPFLSAVISSILSADLMTSFDFSC